MNVDGFMYLVGIGIILMIIGISVFMFSHSVIKKALLGLFILLVGFWMTLISVVSIDDMQKLEVVLEMEEITGEKVTRLVTKGFKKYELVISGESYVVLLSEKGVDYSKK